MEETVSFSHPPPVNSQPTDASQFTSVHQYTASQKKTSPSPLLQLPVRLSHATRLEASNSAPTTNRTRVQSKPNPNDYVEDPSTPIRTRKEAHPISSSDSKPISRTESNESKSSDTDALRETTTHRTTIGPDVERSCKDSIFCPRCKLCRCTKCAEPRPLPGILCCRSRHCLPEDLVVCLSCLWCPVTAYVGCTGFSSDESELEGRSRYEQFCSCGSPPSRACCRRWTCLASMAPCLPCLCLYWPLRWTLAACSACYNYKRPGCRCDGFSAEGVTILEALIDPEEPPSSTSCSSTSRD